MNLWQWLSEPQHVPVLVAMVGIVSGVVGGGVSQLIAGAFKTRGDTRQLSAAKEQAVEQERRWQAEQAFEREKLLNASLREACAQTLRCVASFSLTLTELHLLIKVKADISEYKERLLAIVREFTLAYSEVLLLAPSLKEEVRQLSIRFSELQTAAFRSDDYFNKTSKDLEEAVDVLTASMYKLIVKDSGIAAAVQVAHKSAATKRGTHE